MYGLNLAALLDELVPADGAFDSAAANGLAAIISYEMPGHDLNPKTFRVKAPRDLVSVVRTASNKQKSWALSIDCNKLDEAITYAQAFRHGRAEDEWTCVDKKHINALCELDSHTSLQVLDSIRGMKFDDAVVAVYAEEVAECLPGDLFDRFGMPDVYECEECGRRTMISTGWEASGVFPGEGQCVACGAERSEKDAETEALYFHVERLAARVP